jgi:6-phosphogluconolactonase
MRGELEDPEAAAVDAERDLVSVIGAPPHLDVVLLGMGPDGHVASLFPGHPMLRDHSRWVAHVDDAPKPPPHRLTLTLPALGLAREIWIAVLGEAKAAAVHTALDEPASVLPAALVTRAATRVLWLLDPPAASQWSGRLG